MRLKIAYITVLLLGLGLSASAQKKKSKAKQPAQKHASAKDKKKAAKLEKKAKGENVAKAPVKDSATLKGATIEILQSYKPEVKLAPKPDAAPALPPVDVSTPKLQYDVPPQSLYYSYNFLPLRPLALAKDPLSKGFENYVKAGGGNLGTLLIDAGFGGLHGEKYETAFHVHNLSMSNNALGQKTRQTGLEAEGTLHAGKTDLHAGLDVYNDLYSLYGFVPASSAMNKTYTGVKVGIDAKPSAVANGQFFYHPSINFLLHNDNMAGSEKKIMADVPFSYKQSEELKLYAGVKLTYDNFDRLFKTTNNYVFQFSPGVEYNKGAFSGKLGLYPTLGTSNSYLLPDIEARIKVKGTQLAVYAGLKGILNQNTYEELSMRNPYVHYSYNIQQTHANELFGGVQTNIGNNLTLAGRVSYWQYDNMLMFVNDTTNITQDTRQNFLAVYDKVSAVSLQASVRYQVADIIAVGVSGTYTGFTAKNFNNVWQEPGVRFNADLSVRPLPQLTITGYLSVIDELYAYDVNNRKVRMAGAFDLGGGAEYSFIPRLSAFINVKNILNSKYERWYGYQVYGFNVFGGLRFKF